MTDGVLPDHGLAGFYDVAEVGRGGFGTVYRAVEMALGRAVAVKVLSSNLDPAARERFAREGLAMSRLSAHPNVVPIYAVGVTTNGRPYFVMPFAARGSAAAVLDTTGPLPWQESVRLTVRLAGALETAHRAGILHRDIKPANILLSEYSEPLLTDFGIARVRGAFETANGQFSATIAYAAPEVLDGKPPSVASDLYSLGSTLFALIDGHPPFEMSDDQELASLYRSIACDAIPDLRARGVPDAVCAVIDQAMAKAPQDRPASAADFGALLQGAQRAAQVAVTEMAVAQWDVPASTASPRPTVAVGCLSGTPVARPPAAAAMAGSQVSSYPMTTTVANRLTTTGPARFTTPAATLLTPTSGTH